MPPPAVPVAMLASSLGFAFVVAVAVGVGDGFAKGRGQFPSLAPLNIEALTPSFFDDKPTRKSLAGYTSRVAPQSLKDA